MKKSIPLLVALLYAIHALAQSGSSLQRPLVPEDLPRLEELAKPFAFTMALSPDGESVAFGVTRPAISSEHFGFQFSDFTRQDIWVARIGHQAQNITRGQTDDSGFWWPRWSPDGRYLAVLSTRGGNVTAWVWDKRAGSLEIVTKRGVSSAFMLWISNDELAFPALPDGVRPYLLDEKHRVARLTSENWAKAWRGRESTASVLESGVEPPTNERGREELVVVNVVTKQQRIVTTGSSFQNLQLSPDRRFLAYEKQVGVWRPDPNQIPETHYVHELYELGVVDLREGYVANTLSGVSDVFTSRMGWSADSSQLAVIGYSTLKHSDEDPQVFRCIVKEMTCRAATTKLSVTGPYRANRVGARGVPGRGFLWYGENKLLVYGASQGVASGPTQQSMKWWVVEGDGHQHEFFKDSVGAPTQLLAQSKGEGLVGIVRGDVWTIGNDGRLLQNLTAQLGEKISSIVWPQAWATSIQPVGAELIVGVQRKEALDLYSLNVDSDTLSPVQRPEPDAELAAYDSKARFSVFAASGRTGSYVWLHKPEAKPSMVFQANTFLRDVYEGDFRKIEYRGLDGQDLKAWIIVPFNYKAGKQYPVVTWVYTGLVWGDNPPGAYADFNNSNPLTGQLLASHGYVVLYPSMPRKPFGEDADSYLELTKGALPAVDKLIELGIADPKRVGLIGHSYGGYDTYGLITQTNRFKAAVSLDGFCDFVSKYGTFDVLESYTSVPHENLFNIVQTEADLGNPPWKDAGRYFRNSPINYVDRVQTPLLIMHGDLDYVPIQQAEEFFMALYRENKRARFVRYFGEGHIYESPANVRDMWQQIYSWFDEFLKPESPNRSSRAGTTQ